MSAGPFESAFYQMSAENGGFVCVVEYSLRHWRPRSGDKQILALVAQPLPRVLRRYLRDVEPLE